MAKADLLFVSGIAGLKLAAAAWVGELFRSFTVVAMAAYGFFATSEVPNGSTHLPAR